MLTRRLAAVIIAAIFAGVAVSSAVRADDATVWRHAIINPKADAGFNLMAAKHGFAEKQRLKLNILNVKDDQIGLRALLAGEIDSYEASPTGAIAAAARGADIKLLGCEWLNVPHGLMVRDDIKSVKDLEGKSIAVSAPGSMPDMIARAALAKANVPDSQVSLAAVGGDRDRYSALVGGVVQAAVVSNEYLPLPSSKHFKMLVNGGEALPDLVRTCVITTGKTVATRRSDLIRFMTAEIQGFHYAVAHRDATIQLTRDVMEAKPNDPRPAFVFDEAVGGSEVAPNLPIPMAKLAWMQDEMIKLGQVSKPVDLKKMIASDIRAAAGTS